MNSNQKVIAERTAFRRGALRLTWRRAWRLPPEFTSLHQTEPNSTAVSAADDSLTEVDTGAAIIAAAQVRRNLARKRLFDLAVAILGAVVWLPVLTIAALALAVADGRPIFYRSTRRVYLKESAKVVKFRVMRRDAERLANRDTIPVYCQRFLNLPIDSPLYTPVGRLFEKMHLTELPQFIQVVSGTMSIIGSRPLPENVIDSLEEEFPFVERRFDTRSGMAGPVQLVGRENISDRERLMIEVDYCIASRLNYSMRRDLFILVATILVAAGLVTPWTPVGARELMYRF